MAAKSSKSAKRTGAKKPTAAAGKKPAAVKASKATAKAPGRKPAAAKAPSKKPAAPKAARKTGPQKTVVVYANAFREMIAKRLGRG